MTTLCARDLVLTREKNGVAFTLRVPRLELEPGTVLAVVGESGCGKSSLLDMLALILKPTSGSLLLHRKGQTPMELTTASQNTLAAVRSARMGYVLQSGGLLPFLSVEENILLPARLLGLLGAGAGTRVQKQFASLVGTLKIREQLAKKPQHLSGGQRQRVAIARALIHQPDIVLADEPTAAVDSDTARNICVEFKSVAVQSGAAVVIVSHDRPLMQEYAQRMVTFRLDKDLNGHPVSTVCPEEGQAYPSVSVKKADIGIVPVAKPVQLS